MCCVVPVCPHQALGWLNFQNPVMGALCYCLQKKRELYFLIVLNVNFQTSSSSAERYLFIYNEQKRDAQRIV